MAVKKGDNIKINYTGKFDDGEVFDSSEHHGKPLDVEVGAGKIIPGLDKALEGMEKGEKKTVRIEADEAYGQPRDDLKQTVPKEQVPAEVKEGSMLAVTLPNGQQLPARVTSVTEQDVTLDLNHPLAGKRLTFEVEIVE